MHAGELATVQLLEDGEVAGVRLGSGDGVEDADEFGLALLGGVDESMTFSTTEESLWSKTLAAPQRLIKS